jgi:biopolymer transport protein ExbD
MAGIDVGGSHGRRALDHTIPLIPFIDFLLCLVAFLLVTAVWSQMARLSASAMVPGKESTVAPPAAPELHVRVGERAFELEWRQGETMIAKSSLERRVAPLGAVAAAHEDARFPELAARIAEEWQRHGQHRAPSDARRDVAVVHAPNLLPYGELAAVLDALHAPKRAYANEQVSAFGVSFAMN